MRQTLALIPLLALSISSAPAATVTTIARTGKPDFSGDGGPATE